MLAVHAALMLLVLLGAGPAPQSPPPSPAKPTIEKPRPDWTNAKEGLIDEGYQKIILIGPYSTEPECDREIPVKLDEAVAEYARSYSPQLGSHLHIDGETLHREQPRLVREAYHETIQSSVGPMRQIHLRLVFDYKFNRWLDQKLAQLVIARRLNILAVAGAAVLGVLAVAFLWARRNPAPG